MEAITFEQLREKQESKPKKDSEVVCKLLLKLKDGYLVSVDEEWEGIIPKNHVLENINMEDGQLVKALVISGPDKSDRLVVSPKVFKERAIYDKLQVAKEEGSPVLAVISKQIKGGAEAFIDGVRAFIPGRYIKLPGLSPEEWEGKEVAAYLEEINLKEKSIILNQKKARDLERQKEAEETVQKINEGDILEVKVLRVADFGAFVDLGGLDGLVPASELTWGRFNHPKEVVKPGDMLKAKVFRVEKDKKRVALSVKQLQSDPWENVGNEVGVGSKITGKIIGESKFGVFVEIMPGIEGLLHNSEMESEERPKLGENVTAEIIKISLEDRKIALATKSSDSSPPEVVQEAPKEEDVEQESPKEESSEEGNLEMASAGVGLDNLNLSDDSKE